jgi:ribosomal protein S18 acetylase RimI-like enzyme
MLYVLQDVGEVSSASKRLHVVVCSLLSSSSKTLGWQSKDQPGRDSQAHMCPEFAHLAVCQRLLRPLVPYTYACLKSPASAADPTHSGSSTCQPTQSVAKQLLSSSVVGYIVVQVNSVTAHINKLAVAPEARRAGLATLLLRVRALAWSPLCIACAAAA